jgi:hypothetical protein
LHKNRRNDLELIEALTRSGDANRAEEIVEPQRADLKLSFGKHEEAALTAWRQLQALLLLQ